MGYEEKYCQWVEDSPEYEPNTFETECKSRHVFFEGGPLENKHKYCPYCGKEISVIDTTVQQLEVRDE